MAEETLSIKVELPALGDDEFEALIIAITDAVHERVVKRLQMKAEGAQDEKPTS